VDRIDTLEAEVVAHVNSGDVAPVMGVAMLSTILHNHRFPTSTIQASSWSFRNVGGFLSIFHCTSN
jgi:hypothetical protein